MVHRSKISVQKEVVTARFSPPIPIEDQRFYEAVARINNARVYYEDSQKAVADSILPWIQPRLKSYINTLSAYAPVKRAIPDCPTAGTIDVLLERDVGKEWLRLIVSYDPVVASMRTRSQSRSDTSQKDGPKSVIKGVELYGAVDLGAHELYAAKGQDWHLELVTLIAEALLENKPVSPVWKWRLEDYGGYQSKAYVMESRPKLFLINGNYDGLPCTLFIHHRRLTLPIHNPTVKRMAEASRVAQDVHNFYAAHPELEEAIDLLHEVDNMNQFTRTGLKSLENEIEKTFKEVSEKTGETLSPPDVSGAKRSIRNKTKKYVEQINAIIQPLQSHFPREVMKYARG